MDFRAGGTNMMLELCTAEAFLYVPEDSPGLAEAERIAGKGGQGWGEQNEVAMGVRKG